MLLGALQRAGAAGSRIKIVEVQWRKREWAGGERKQDVAPRPRHADWLGVAARGGVSWLDLDRSIHHPAECRSVDGTQIPGSTHGCIKRHGTLRRNIRDGAVQGE